MLRILGKNNANSENENMMDPLVAAQVSKDLDYFIQKGYCVIDTLPDIESSSHSD